MQTVAHRSLQIQQSGREGYLWGVYSVDLLEHLVL